MTLKTMKNGRQLILNNAEWEHFTSTGLARRMEDRDDEDVAYFNWKCGNTQYSTGTGLRKKLITHSKLTTPSKPYTPSPEETKPTAPEQPPPSDGGSSRLDGYNARILGKDRPVKSWSGPYELQFSDGSKLALTPLSESECAFSDRTVLEILSLCQTGGIWVVGDESLDDYRRRAMAGNINEVFNPPTKTKPIYQFELAISLPEILQKVEEKGDAEKICAIAILGESKSSDGWATPVLLKRFHEIPVPASTPACEPDPDFFFNYAAAAKYKGVTSRTIQNWVRRDYLPVDQNGRKIRIARADLDNCR